MRRNLFVIAGALALAVAAVMLFTGFGFAQANGPDEGGYSWGESSEGDGPGLQNTWGQPDTGSQEEAAGVAVDDGDCCDDGPWGPKRSGEGGNRHGDSSEGDGPDLYNQWGKQAH